MNGNLPDYNAVLDASKRIEGKVELTPVINCPELDATLGCTLWMKCDQLQPTGAFKLRGASHAITRLQEQGIEGDVATHSSGNHGAALARAARAAGRRAIVVMPRDAVPAKIEAVRHFGGEVQLCEPGQGPRETGLAALVKQGLIPIPPYDHDDIIAGQGTAALELFDVRPDLEVLVTPLGGGGLLAGCALAAHGRSSSVDVFGAEPAGAADAHASLAAGERVDQWQPDTIADGLRAIVGVRNFAIIRQHVAGILLADDDAIIRAMRLIHEQTNMRVEPSSAVAIAAIALHPEYFAGHEVGVIMTGGNIDLDLFPWLTPERDET